MIRSKKILTIKEEKEVWRVKNQKLMSISEDKKLINWSIGLIEAVASTEYSVTTTVLVVSEKSEGSSTASTSTLGSRV